MKKDFFRLHRQMTGQGLFPQPKKIISPPKAAEYETLPLFLERRFC
jgi:hypothetical protein